MEIREIENKIAQGEMSAAQVFTQMRQHVRDEIGIKTGVLDVNGVHIQSGDFVRVNWLAELGITELDCEADGEVRYMSDNMQAAFFIEFDKPYIRFVCEDGNYEEERIMLMQADEDMCISFEVIDK